MTDDLYPAYVALIRHELHLEPGADTLAELASRLSPDDPTLRPPYRAPAIVRLRRALKRLRADRCPADSLEQFGEDLRVLMLFSPDEPILAPEGMERLLRDVLDDAPGQPAPARIVRLRPKDRKAGLQ